MRRTLTPIAIALLLLSVLATGALAYWTATSAEGSYGAAEAGEMPTGEAPSVVIAGSNPHDVLVSWAPSTLSSGDPVTEYEVSRYEVTDIEDVDIDLDELDGDEACDGTVDYDPPEEPEDPPEPVTCTDENVPTGDWVYTITPVLNEWIGAEGDRSGRVIVGGATLSIDPPTTVADLPKTLEGEVAGFFSMEEIEFALGAENGDDLAGTVDEVETPATVKANGSADVTIDLPEEIDEEDFPEGANTIYAVGAGYDITHEDLSTEHVDGNVASAGIYVDTIAPQAPTITSSPPASTTSRVATFSFTGEANATFRCKLDTGTFEVCTSPQSYGSEASPLATGPHAFYVKAVDGAGNESSETSYPWVIGDATSPTVTITFPQDATTYTPAGYTGGCTVLVDDICGTALDNGTSGLKEVHVSIRQGTGNYWDGDGFNNTEETWFLATGTSNWTYGFLQTDFPGPGSYTVRARATTNNSSVGYDSNTFTIDNPPHLVSISQADPNPTNLSSVDYTVTFSEPVTGVDVGDFTRTTTGLSGNTDITGVTGSETTYNVAVNTGTGNGTLRLNLVDDNSIVDGSSNALVAEDGTENGSRSGDPYDIDKTAPTVSSVTRTGTTPTKAGEVDYTVTFSESVTGVDATDFSLATTGVSGASVSDVGGTGATRTVTVNTGTGSGTITLSVLDDNTIVDAAGNPQNGAFTGGANQQYTIDKTAPTVVSISRHVPSTATANAFSVTFRATFSESVTGVDLTDFALAGTASDATLDSISGSGTTRDIVVNIGNQSGSLGLNLVDDDTIVDGVGNNLGGTGPGNGNFTGDSYTTVNRPPHVVSINRVQALRTNLNTVDWTVTFSENVTGVNTGASSDFSVNPTLTGAGVPSLVSGSGSVYTVRVTPTSSSTNSGQLGLRLDDNNSIVDANGATLVIQSTGADLVTFQGQEYTIDKIVPVGTPSTVDVGGAGGNDGLMQSGDQIRISFTETMNVTSICSTWSGNTANQSLSDGIISVNNNAGSGNVDTITVTSASCGLNGFRFGQLNLGSSAYMTGTLPTTALFTSSTLAWDATNNRLVLTFGTLTPGASPVDVNAKSIFTWVPAGAPAVADPAGNTATGANSEDVRQF